MALRVPHDPRVPELLVQGRQGPYFDFFFHVLAADPASIPPDARTVYAEAYASNAALTAGFGFYRGFAQDVRDNLDANSAPTDTPVLYVRGAASGGDTDRYAQGLRAAGVRRVSTGLVAEAGHFIPDEQPAELWRHVREFITSCSG